jgi:cyclopropane fatty-acyl-phospholipid synthase-like methyltransferase
MGTKDFNALDMFICRWRSRTVRRHVRRGATVLDFGCGHQLLFLRSVQTEIKRGVGLDYDAIPGRPAGNLEVRNFHFKDRFDFADRSFDQVTLLAVLEHIALDQVDTLFREFARLLADGGQVLITTPTPAAKPVLEFLAFRLHVISEPEIADHRHYYSEADLQALAARHGLTCSTYHRFLFGFNCFAAFTKAAP